MVAAASLFPLQDLHTEGEQRILLSNVSWKAYVALRDGVESPAVRMTYLEGELEIMTTSREHKVTRKQIARLLELFCLERDIPLFAYGQMTFQDEDTERGLEADECYARGKDKPIPDLALEVVVTRGLLDKLEVYRGLGIREVWVFEAGAFRILALRNDHYEAIPVSEVLSEPDLARIAHFAEQPDQHIALRTFRDELRRAL
ncbi:MAG TPA: Uma2 family endonuclease [Polyangiaceae bacterium]|nr:Uma2 family endonuclease [Polyangiaceae bacterium]